MLATIVSRINRGNWDRIVKRAASEGGRMRRLAISKAPSSAFKIAGIATLSALFLLFESLIPVIVLIAVGGVYLFRRMEARTESAPSSKGLIRPTAGPREYRATQSIAPRQRESIASRIMDSVAFLDFRDTSSGGAPSPIENKKLALADVIPINNSFAPAWKDLDDFLQATLDVIKTRFDFQTANVFLFEPTSNTLIQSAYVTRTNSVARLAAIKVGHGLVGWVAKNMRPLVVSNLKHEGRSLGYYRLGGERIASFAAAPITVDGKLAGVIALDHHEPDRFESPATEEALSAMAGLLARVLGAEECLETTRREVDRLRETRRILQSAYDAKTLDTIASNVLKSIVSLTGFHSLSCYLLNEAGEPSRRAEIGFHGIESFHCKETVIVRAVQQSIQQCSPFRIEGLALAAQYRMNRGGGERTPELLVAFPILYRGVALGAIAVEVMDAKVLDDRIDGILSDVVSSLGAGLMRVYRSATAEGTAKMEGDLVKFATDLLSCDEESEIWEKLFNHMVEKTSTRGIVVYRRKEDGYSLVASRGCDDAETTVAEHGGLIGWSALAGRPVAASRDDRRQPPVDVGKSFLACPIMENTGATDRKPASEVILLVSDEENAYSPETAEWASELLLYATPILRKARKIDEAREILDVDRSTGLFNADGFRRRIPCLSYSGEVGLVLMRVENVDELLATYGHAETGAFLTGVGSTLRMKMNNTGISRTGSVISARLEGSRFGVAANGDPEPLKRELLRILAASKAASMVGTPISYSLATASTSDGVPVAELVDAAEVRFLSGMKETRTVFAA